MKENESKSCYHGITFTTEIYDTKDNRREVVLIWGEIITDGMQATANG